jgi:hypothetical protein
MFPTSAVTRSDWLIFKIVDKFISEACYLAKQFISKLMPVANLNYLDVNQVLFFGLSNFVKGTLYSLKL